MKTKQLIIFGANLTVLMGFTAYNLYLITKAAQAQQRINWSAVRGEDDGLAVNFPDGTSQLV